MMPTASEHDRYDPASDPVLCDPYQEPDRHWRLDTYGRAMPGEPLPGRRPSLVARFVPDDTKTPGMQQEWDFGLVEQNLIVEAIRSKVSEWRSDEYPKVTGITRKLLIHWADEGQCLLPPFFAQREAIETMIWLREVATRSTPERREIEELSREFNDGIVRYAAKMATGAGKTAVMGMLIAWQTLNAVSTTRSRNLRHGQRFAVLTPGLTVRERLQVLVPSHPNNIYKEMGLVPRNLRGRLNHARVKIINFQAFARRDLLGGKTVVRDVLRVNKDQGREDPQAAAERVLRELTRGSAYGDVVVINDEAHHCWLPSEQTTRAKNKAGPASVWFNAVRALRDAGHLGRRTADGGQESVVYDFSATPMWIGTTARKKPRLFEWVVSDFPLMDAIESGMVKVPRVPIDDDTEQEQTVWRNLYSNTYPTTLKDDAPPPQPLYGAARALYADYVHTHTEWTNAGLLTPPVMIVVANSISNAGRLFNWIAGHERNGGLPVPGNLSLLSNVDENGKWYNHPRTLLVHSQIDEGRDELSDAVGKLARQQVQRYAETTTDKLLAKRLLAIKKPGEALRLMMNTVGTPGQPGEQVRCVVSVDMLTEGWDVRTVTHVLGFRRFGTQLLCEQVTGRALRRSSYESWRKTEDGRRLLEPEYADVVGVPFEFMPAGSNGTPKPPKRRHVVESLPDREHLRISFPIVEEYVPVPPRRRIELNPDNVSRYDASAALFPSITALAGVTGEEKLMTESETTEATAKVELTAALVRTFSNNPDHASLTRGHLFRDLYRAVGEWMNHPNVSCPDPKLLLASDHEQNVIEAILAACELLPETNRGGWTARLSYPPLIDTGNVRFETAMEHIHKTVRSELNLAACDTGWELRCAEILDDHPHVTAWTRNYIQLGWTLPYHYNGAWRPYHPDS